MLRKGHILAILVIGFSVTTFLSISAQQNYDIAAWIKDVAGFWAEDRISDQDFVEGISFLINNKIIKVPLIQELEDENKKLKSEISSLSYENSNLKLQVTKLTQQSKNTPTYAPPATTTQPVDLNYPKITKRYDGDSALKKLQELATFNDSLTSSQRSELALRSVPQSEFVIAVVFAGEFILTITEGNFEMNQISGSNVMVIPFDCSHNFEYIYSIVAGKDDELGKISLYVFKNGVAIDLEESEKPYGMATAAGQCDESSVLR